MKRIAVIGAGSWGTALGIIAARAGHDVKFWSRNPAVVNSLNDDRVNSIYLPDTEIPEGVVASADIIEVVERSELVIIATPSHATRAVLESMVAALPETATLVSAAKGIEIESGKRISQLVAEVLGPSSAVRFVSLSGPSFAKEVVAQHPTAIVAASANPEARAEVQSALSSES